AFCPHCQASFRISHFIRIPCPGCRRPLRVPPDFVQDQLKCKYCKQAFHADPADAPSKITPTIERETSPPDEKEVLQNKVLALEEQIRTIQQALTAQANDPSKTILETPSFREVEQLQRKLREKEQALSEAIARGRDAEARAAQTMEEKRLRWETER